MARLILVFLIFLSVNGFCQEKKTLLAIFPHPDDESAVGEVLAKYSQSGYRVKLVIATDGKDGTRVTKIPAGDSLGNIRKDETRCACRILGIDEPIFLGIERLDTKIGVGKYFREHKKFLDTLRKLIPSIDPSFIITFGPDGDTHHSEHIVTGAAVTELLLAEGWVARYPLYYLAWNQKQGKTFDLGFVDDRYMNVRITYSQEQENLALSIMPCYKTQYTEGELKDDRSKKLSDPHNFISFRKFEISERIRDHF